MTDSAVFILPPGGLTENNVQSSHTPGSVIGNWTEQYNTFDGGLNLVTTTTAAPIGIGTPPQNTNYAIPANAIWTYDCTPNKVGVPIHIEAIGFCSGSTLDQIKTLHLIVSPVNSTTSFTYESAHILSVRVAGKEHDVHRISHIWRPTVAGTYRLALIMAINPASTQTFGVNPGAAANGGLSDLYRPRITFRRLA